MSGLVGFWNRDARPAPPGAVERMVQEIAHRGPDGLHAWTSGSFAAGYAAVDALPESDCVSQPLVDERARCVLAFDGRIDNAGELTKQLIEAGYPPRSFADAEIVLRACQAWFDGAPAQLLGDFAFVFWHEDARRLLCARDVSGIRPLYYRQDGHRFAWASELLALVRPPFDQPPPNEGFIAEHLANILNSTSETMFAGVYRLPPASQLVVSPDHARCTRYWQIDPKREIRYADSREYDAHFCRVVEEAVECRLRTGGSAGVLLSGGLDSSVLTGMAVQVAGRARAPKTFSLSYPGRACDERSYIEDVVRKWALDATIVETPSVNPYEADVQQYLDLPSYPSSAGAEPLLVRAREQGVRVLMTGLGGDEWFTGHSAHYADMLGRMQLLPLWRAMAADRRAGIFGSWRQSLWNTVRPFFPDPVLEAARRAVRHSPIPRWIRPSFAARVGLRDRIYSAPRRFAFPTHAQNELYREATAGFVVHGHEMLNRSVSKHGLDVTHPLHDRRVVEFAVAIPEEERWHDGRPKAIVRRAAGHLLPERVRTRDSDLDYDFPYVEAMRRLNARARLGAPSDVFDEWIDRRLLLGEYDRVVGVPGANDWPIWMAIAVRLWSDAVVERRESVGVAVLAPQVVCPEDP